MRGPTHLLAGILIADQLAVHLHEPLSVMVAGIGAGAVAALAPDLDHPKSMASLAIPGNHRGGLQGLWYVLHIRHRGAFHSPFAATMVALATLLAAHHWWPVAAGFLALTVGLCFLSHLVLDLVEPTPQPWLWPLVKRPLRPRWLPAVKEASLLGQLLDLPATILYKLARREVRMVTRRLLPVAAIAAVAIWMAGR